MTIPQAVAKNHYDEDLFSLAISFEDQSTYIKMNMRDSRLLTSELPATCSLLQKHLPSIFECKCFNQDGLPFREEVKDTEVAHLFEHILLEYLCKYSLYGGHDDISFRGETSWNWMQESRGIFHIDINAGFKDIFSFQAACVESISLFNKILHDSH